MGPFHPTLGGPPKHHIVRVGWNTPKLQDEAHFDIWALAHGLPAEMSTEPWTRQALIDAADDAEKPGAATILDNLVELGLVVEVARGSDRAREFANSYCVRSLLMGLGNTREDPARDGIGIAGLPPILKVRPRVFEIWQWAHLWPTIWSACEGIALVTNPVEGSGAEHASPESVLDFMLDAFRDLISHGAIYLDLQTTTRRANTSD